MLLLSKSKMRHEIVLPYEDNSKFGIEKGSVSARELNSIHETFGVNQNVRFSPVYSKKRVKFE